MPAPKLCSLQEGALPRWVPISGHTKEMVLNVSDHTGATLFSLKVASVQPYTPRGQLTRLPRGGANRC
jgi:hypothetical protein